MQKILLVDDEQSLAKLFQYNLSKAGFECEIATNAEDGLRLAKSIQPDIIVSDIMMPNVDGFQFRRMILTDPNLRSVPFVFLTSKGEEKDILDGYDLGIADYVLKTAGPRVVVAKVSAIIKSLGKERQKIVTELHQAADSLRVKVVPDNSPEFAGFDIKHWHIPFHGIPTQIQVSVFHAQFFPPVGIVFDREWRYLGSIKDLKGFDIDLDFPCIHFHILVASFSNQAGR